MYLVNNYILNLTHNSIPTTYVIIVGCQIQYLCHHYIVGKYFHEALHDLKTSVPVGRP